jgi:hypothetical protein
MYVFLLNLCIKFKNKAEELRFEYSRLAAKSHEVKRQKSWEITEVI